MRKRDFGGLYKQIFGSSWKHITEKGGCLMAYISNYRVHPKIKLSKKEILMACISKFRTHFGMGLPKKESFDGIHVS